MDGWRIDTGMVRFWGWLSARTESIQWPEADRVLPVIAAAGRAGITRAELGKAIKLRREVLDELLQALVDAGQIVAGVDQLGKLRFWDPSLAHSSLKLISPR